MQRQPAADRDTNSGHGALDGCHKPTDDDVEAQQQIRNAVAPECTDGVGDELIARVRKVRAHDLRREEKGEQKQRRREDADGRERVAQKFLTARVILFAVVIAHKRLRALRDADHEVNDNGRHVSDDRVGHDAVRADALEHRAVEEEDHQPRAQLCHAVGQADGQDARVKVRVEAKFAQPERALLAEKVDKVRDTGHELRDARGDRRAEHAHVEVKNGDIVKHAVRQASADNREERVARIAVCLDEHFEIVGHQIAHAERRDAENILLDIVKCDLVCAEKVRKRLQKEQHERSDDRAKGQQRGKILRKEGVGLAPLLLRDENGDERRRADGEEHGDGKKRVGEGNREIDGAHGIFVHTDRDHKPVDHGVEREHDL